MANRFFQKIANDVLEASEKLSARLEDGISAIFTGELPASSQPNDPNLAGQGNEGQASSVPSEGVGGDTDYGSSQTFEETAGLLDGEDAYGGTPLEGIARGVLGDIMANQVRLSPSANSRRSSAKSALCSSYSRTSFSGCCSFVPNRLDPRRPWTNSMRSGTPSLGRSRLFCRCSRSSCACSSPACLCPVGVGGCTHVSWSWL